MPHLKLTCICSLDVNGRVYVDFILSLLLLLLFGLAQARMYIIRAKSNPFEFRLSIDLDHLRRYCWRRWSRIDGYCGCVLCLLYHVLLLNMLNEYEHFIFWNWWCWCWNQFRVVQCVLYSYHCAVLRIKWRPSTAWIWWHYLTGWC